eukprot:2943892-Alexandrium_andersonii.AAC.1
MAKHDRPQPAGQLLGSAPRPRSNNHRSNGDGPQAADLRYLILGVLRDVDLPPPLQGRRPASPLAGPEEEEELVDGGRRKASQFLGAPSVRPWCLATTLP